MRQGELLALRWQDVDLMNGTLSVRHTLTRSGRRVVIGEPKTKKSRRSLYLTPRAVEALEAHLERQLREIEILGDRYKDRRLLFHGYGRSDQSVKPTQAEPRTPAEEGEAAAHPLPRSQAHLRDVVVGPGDAPQVRPGAPWPRHHSDNARHLFPRDAGHGRSDRACHAERTLLRRGPDHLTYITLVSRWCQRGPGLIPALCFISAFSA
jgi:hypothetical protein